MTLWESGRGWPSLELTIWYLPTVMELLLMSSEMHLVCPDWSSNLRDSVEEEKRTKIRRERCTRGFVFEPIIIIMIIEKLMFCDWALIRLWAKRWWRRRFSWERWWEFNNGKVIEVCNQTRCQCQPLWWREQRGGQGLDLTWWYFIGWYTYYFSYSNARFRVHEEWLGEERKKLDGK